MHNTTYGQTPPISALDPRQLLKYAEDTSEEGRYLLANAVSRFFEERRLSEHEHQLVSEIMLSLIRQAEVDIRHALAEKLSVQDNIPSEVIVFLANDEISVARPVLLHSPVLKDIDLMYIIGAKGQDHWRSIAERSHLSPMVAEKLIDTGDVTTVINLMNNQKTVLQKNALKKLLKASLVSESLQESLIRRPEIDGDIAVDLYMCVSHALREEISMRFHVHAGMIDGALEALAAELCHEAKGYHQVTEEMKAVARRFRERDAITADLLITTLRRGQQSFFVALFGARLGLCHHAVIRLAQKDNGLCFALACRSMGMIKSEFASLYLLSRSIGTSTKAVINQRELASALKYFDSLKDFDVQRIIRKWTKDPELV